MKHWKKLVTTFAIITIAAFSSGIYGCGGSSDADSESGESQIVEVTRGSLMTQISSFGSVSLPEQAELTFGSGQSANDLYTVSEIKVEFGDTVKEGDILAKLDSASLERDVIQAESDLRTAQINLEQETSETNLLKAQASVKSAELALAEALEDVETAKTTDIQDAEASMRNAQIQLESVITSLAAAKLDAESRIDSAEDAVADAYQAYNVYVADNIDELTLPYIAAEMDELYEDYQLALEDLEITGQEVEDSIATAENNVTKAEETLQKAEDSLTGVQIDSLAYQKKELAVAQAEVNLAQAEDDLAYVEAGHDIELLQIKVDNAQVDLDDALEQLEAATIVAPFDGVVAAVNASVGDEVTPSKVIIYLVSTCVVEVDAAVDEIDVASVEEGQMAIVTLDAIADARLRGSVTAVSPVATSSSGVVTYDIAVEVQGTDEYELKEGMSATITIMALDVQDVLLVPSNAVQSTVDGNLVQVVGDDGLTEERAVEIGATNGQMTEIISGLIEGEQVEVQMSTDMSEMVEQFQQGGRIPGMGGGMRPQ